MAIESVSGNCLWNQSVIKAAEFTDDFTYMVWFRVPDGADGDGYQHELLIMAGATIGLQGLSDKTWVNMFGTWGVWTANGSDTTPTVDGEWRCAIAEGSNANSLGELIISVYRVVDAVLLLTNTVEVTSTATIAVGNGGATILGSNSDLATARVLAFGKRLSLDEKLAIIEGGGLPGSVQPDGWFECPDGDAQAHVRGFSPAYSESFGTVSNIANFTTTDNPPGFREPPWMRPLPEAGVFIPPAGAPVGCGAHPLLMIGAL